MYRYISLSTEAAHFCCSDPGQNESTSDFRGGYPNVRGHPETQPLEDLGREELGRETVCRR